MRKSYRVTLPRGYQMLRRSEDGRHFLTGETVELEESVAVVRIDDGKANAISPDLVSAVDEALDRADAHLQRVLGSGVQHVCFIHGHGTGALRSAIRAWLRELPWVEGFEAGARSQGGDGVTVATLTH